MRTAPYKADPSTSSSLVPEDPSTDYITIWRHQGHQTLREREGFRVSAGLIDKRCAHTTPAKRDGEWIRLCSNSNKVDQGEGDGAIINPQLFHNSTTEATGLSYTHLVTYTHTHTACSLPGAQVRTSPVHISEA